MPAIVEFKFYDEVDPDQVNELMLISHNEPCDRKIADRIRRNDPFCSPWFRMYAVEGDRVISQVGAAYPEVETTEGTKRAGFVEAVATRASFGRKGYAMKLMKRVHEQMTDDGIELFVLGTSRTLVAYSMYPKLGYHDIKEYNWGLKKGGKFPESDIAIKVRRHKIDGAEALFKRASRGRLGFVLRPEEYPRKKCSWAEFYTKACTFVRKEKPIGYALTREMKDFLSVRELVCPDLKDCGPCLRALERRFPKEYVTRGVSGRGDIAREFERHGFRTMDTWGTLMARDAGGKMTQKQLKALLGIDRDIFQMFPVDTY
jgi:GNAT superfamily N-acetyltransferase